jgi:pyruvate/2-oxoglutarate dehydrogenase complex dihydrolipoamide acyltransferase (E2) component
MVVFLGSVIYATINPPQSGILGMHNIIERPIAVNGKVEIHQ